MENRACCSYETLDFLNKNDLKPIANDILLPWWPSWIFVFVTMATAGNYVKIVAI